MTTPWMTVEEAEAWCDVGISALNGTYLHRVEDIEYVAKMLNASRSEREDVAERYEHQIQNQVWFEYPRRVLCFCATVLRMVKP